MFRIFVFIAFITAAYFWGDWRNWKKYYSSILFFIIVSLLYKVLFHNYPLWRLEPIPPLNTILPNGTFISLTLDFIVFPATTLIFLRYMPRNWLQYPYILFWASIYVIIELIAISQNAISYHNGWNIGWTAFFDVFIFYGLGLHHRKPLLAWAGVLVFIVAGAIYFNLPIESIR